MLRTIASLALALALAPLACAGDDGDDDTSNDSHNDSHDSGNESGGTSANTSVNTSSSMETCMSSHECINDVCTCTTPGMEDMACTDDTACEDECEVCM
ncbi:MAG: hypothetical protein KDK70_00415 [Myxococcales bacterium]|nr:hypothetical protein [Myxococcales bacterium]